MEASGSHRVLSESGEATLGELGRRFERGREAAAHFLGPVADVCEGPFDAIGAAEFLYRTGNDGLILPRERLGRELAGTLLSAGFAIRRAGGQPLELPASTSPGVSGRVTLLTSGTTGAPKLVPHRWETLRTRRESDPLPPFRWLLTYLTGTYAWYQMLTLALFVPGQELVVGERLEPVALLELAVQHGADAISSTPTFWRCALMQADPLLLRRLPLRQITLGGERVDQGLLDRLHGLYPEARRTHIYASAEVGAAISVHDGREGFPAEWLEEGGGRIGKGRAELRIEDGILNVRSPNSSAENRGWVDTGDRVERHGDRVIVVGRRDSSILNVGGLKIASHAIERVLLEHPGVAWCRVRGRDSEFVGALVAADVVWSGPAGTPSEIERELTGHARACLPEFAVPRLWRILDAIPVTESLKAELS